MSSIRVSILDAESLAQGFPGNKFNPSKTLFFFTCPRTFKCICQARSLGVLWMTVGKVWQLFTTIECFLLALPLSMVF